MLKDEGNNALLNHLAETYIKVGERGALWEPCFTGGYTSDYEGNARKKFLARFDEEDQKAIKQRAEVVRPQLRKKESLERKAARIVLDMTQAERDELYVKMMRL